MSVSSDFLSLNITNTTLTTIDHFLQGCVLPLIIVFAIIGNISNIYIFTRPSLYHSCSIYFLAGSVNGLILLLFGTTSRWLSHTFSALDATRYSLFFCRFRNYLMGIIYDIVPYFIACVTVDRFFSSSAEVNTRRWSARPQTACTIIALIILITFAAYSHILIYYTIIDSLCQPKPEFYAKFLSFFSTVYYLTPVVIILIFGLGTTYHIRTQRNKIHTVTIRINQKERRHLRNNGQLLIMLIAQGTCYTCLAMPYHITLIVAAIVPSLPNEPIFLFIQHVTLIALNLNQAVSKNYSGTEEYHI